MAKLKNKSNVKPKKVALKKSINKTKLKKIKTKKRKTNSLGTLSVDEFLQKDFEKSEIASDSEELSDNEINDNDLSEQQSFVEKSEENSDAEKDSSENEVDENEAETHKKDLEKLKKSDPEFYKFLQENDKNLLKFNLSDDEDEDDKEDETEEGVHKPTDKLDVASDESDFEADDDEEKVKDERVVTLKMLKKWQADLHTDKSNGTIIAVTQAFHAALSRVSNPEDIDEPSYFKVDGSAVFNGVIQLCVLELGPSIRRFLGIKPGSKQPPHKCKKFPKIKRVLKTYFTDLLKILMGVTSANIQTVLLKHLHYISPLLVSYPNITKPILKRLVSLWGTGDDSVRVIAFFCILRITNNQQSAVLDTTLKSMYVTYVRNSKFVSLNALASINFMRRSLVEMFSLDTNVSYQHVFLYIRQLAIHLRNAITVKKTENLQAVYNWQFVNSLRLWANLLSATQNKQQMKELLYPLVQVCLGTIKLVPTTQYYPLRFHIVQILMDLSKETNVFIPVLPFLLEVLSTYDFNKKHQKVSMKPVHFTSLLRVSKSQMQENGFKDAVIEMIYGLMLEYLSSQSHTMGFPDLAVFCIIQLKEFLKKCKNPNYSRKMKQILEKIEQNSKFIETERAKHTFNLTDFKLIDGWETQIKNKGTPLTTYFESWNKLRNIKKNKQLTNNEELADYKLPTLKKVNRNIVKSDGPVELFPSDSEDEVEENKNEKPRRGKRGGKNVNKRFVDESGPVRDSGEKDIIEDINIEDW